MKKIIPLLCLLIVGCQSTRPNHVTIEITDPPTESGRYRSQERQRDIWIAPRTVNDEILEHEKVVTFVENRQRWLVSTTLDPNAIPNPQLPQENGDYNHSVILKQKEEIKTHEIEIQKLRKQLNAVEKNSTAEILGKTAQVESLMRQIESLQNNLNSSFERLKLLEGLNQKHEERPQPEAPNPWWKLW